MTNAPKGQPRWHPISALPLIGEVIDKGLTAAEDQYRLLLEAKHLPRVLDDHTVDDLAIASERAVQAARELPKAEKLAGLLRDVTRGVLSVVDDPDSVPDEDWVEDSLAIERVEPGVLWFEGGIGPLKVPREASAVAQVGWSVTVVLARVRGVWHLLEVGTSTDLDGPGRREGPST